MIDDPTEDETPVDTSNFAEAEKHLVKAGRKALDNYEIHHGQHDRAVEKMHQDIIEYGRVLREGRQMYPGNKEFGDWVKRKKLNTGRLGSDDIERSNSLKIANLVDFGHGGSRLDLSKCDRKTPSNIMAWARFTQRHLFPHLAPKSAVITDPKAKPAAAKGRLANTCGFCGKPAAQVDNLLLGPAARPAASICAPCVELAVKLLAERRKPTGKKPRTFEEALREEADPFLDDIGTEAPR